MFAMVSPLHVPCSTAPAYWGPGGDLYRMLVTGAQTGGSCFLLEAFVVSGGGPPLHIHHREEEVFYILEGECSIQIGDTHSYARVGDLVSVPRGVAHRYTNEGIGQLRMLVTFSPSGMDEYFFKTLEPAREIAPAPLDVGQRVIERFLQFADQYGVEFVKPT